jgi:RNA polymerase sigma factor (sigma-70 family)
LNAEVLDFAQFIRAREQSLQRTAWLLTGDWGLAEDLVQTALARSWPRWERINRRDDPEVYVRRVMVNTWITWSRRRWRTERASPEVEVAEAAAARNVAGQNVAGGNIAARDMASEVATRMTLRDALATLSSRQRAVLVLRVYDDLPEAQVAQILNCSVGTVKSAQSRALARLREELRLAGYAEREAR